MTTPRKAGIGVAVALAVAIVGFEAALVAERSAELAGLREEEAHLIREAAGLRRERLAAAAELRSLQDQLAEREGKVAAGGAELDPARRSLLLRAQRLRELFAERPALATPELDLLTATDWLRLVRDAELGSEPEIRRAMAAARYRATEQLYARIGPVVQTYASRHARWPALVEDFASELPTPLNPAYFRRYRMLIDGEIMPATTRFPFDVAAEIEPVDPEYDLVQASLNTGGRGANRTPWAMVPLRDAAQQARLAMARENGGNITGDYVAYFQPPSFGQVWQARSRFLAATRHVGPIEGTMLAPYLATDEERALAEKFWPKLPAAR